MNARPPIDGEVVCDLEWAPEEPQDIYHPEMPDESRLIPLLAGLGLGWATGLITGLVLFG